MSHSLDAYAESLMLSRPRQLTDDQISDGQKLNEKLLTNSVANF